MKPKEYNKLNTQRRTIEKVEKYCNNCKNSYLVSNYLSQCPSCRSHLVVLNQNVPRCPTCQSTNIKKISSAKRSIYATTFGVFNKTAQSQFECNNCGYKW